MKVAGPTAPTPQSARGPTRGAAGFSLPQAGSPGAAGAASASAPAAGLGDLSALMALQGVEDVTERRRRAVRRGFGLLDRLDDLKLAMLSGDAGEAALGRLSRSLSDDRPVDLQPGLAAVLDQIELRAAVELAKAEVRRTAT
ncbi:flagellar assembly protein FliX [Brevundimonas sp.]|uniref:flagellar assembly protein FliX n=1 Tax=Brevundimonas sp. TaxID=1871086 RepID=UPI002AB93692|nr:flagellar assembly protein FliX [Brevundimonas sp.]MDZ4364520.1 flagellar assembly protein FliX [Brevundimonas sp.]